MSIPVVMRNPSRLLVAAFLLFGLAACDSAVLSDNVVVLRPAITAGTDGTPVRFSFQASDVGVGNLTDVRCNCELDVADYLSDRGFTKSDITSATLESAKLVMRFPISERIDFLNQAILKFRAPGNSATEVARQMTFPDARVVTLTPQSGRDVSGFMDDSAFEPILQIDPASLQAGGDYAIDLELTLRLELRAN
ncbi:MAG: hypothetical protein ACI80V_001446 [Rhodothermales bacterium]|jgi:hypothetical protein